jgi:hypothetical protein
MTVDDTQPGDVAGLSGPPSRLFSVVYGALGGMALSVAGFVPWAVTGKWLYRAVGEAGMYVVCALVFIALSGPLLHRLLAGPPGAGRLKRFYKVFGLAFAAYAAAWIGGWMAFGGHVGSVAGLLAGALAMACVMVLLFRVPGRFGPAAAVLFGPTAVGYFLGGIVESRLMALARELGSAALRTGAMLSWGVFFCLGFGAGLGLALHLCQQQKTGESPRAKN